ncbi:MAG TPA: class I SAM-dependent methyltransferase [Nitrososphaerales archaeon]|nr:class I SAM-dependent methyltransferase [Nitrososphaerales archaeon]
MSTKQTETDGKTCPPEDCDTFQFMSKRLGMKVLHPGGLEATALVARACDISNEAIILDAGCGRGSTARFLAERYGCRVVGVDVDADALFKAQLMTENRGIGNRIAFRLADLHELPFEEETFDGAIAQAVLIFTDKRRALRQITRRVKKGGFVGVLELTWILPPTAHMVEKVRSVLCRAAVNAETRSGWIAAMDESGLSVVHDQVRKIRFGFSEMLRNEGVASAARIALKSVFDSATRQKVGEINQLFAEMHEYLGYGIYIGRKP